MKRWTDKPHEYQTGTYLRTTSPQGQKGGEPGSTRVGLRECIVPLVAAACCNRRGSRKLSSSDTTRDLVANLRGNRRKPPATWVRVTGKECRLPATPRRWLTFLTRRVFTYIHMGVTVWAYLYASMHVNMHVLQDRKPHIYVCRHINICMWIYICMYGYIYTYCHERGYLGKLEVILRDLSNG